MQLKWPMLWDLFSLFPAYAGVILLPSVVGALTDTFPRIRGGDPEFLFDLTAKVTFSPHTRG